MQPADASIHDDVVTDSSHPVASPGRDPRPGGPEIRLHRLPRRRIPLLIAAAATLVAALAASQRGLPRRGPRRPHVATSTTTSTTLPTPVASTAGPGVYGAPLWLPLRRDLAGAEVKVGCTFESHGSQHGYECSGHHGRWAIDFIAESGTPVYAAGAGFATNITGQPGGSGFGNVVRIDHGMGISTVYAHLTTAIVPAEGKWVDETTLIGTVGSTGSSSTAHLHFERFSIPSPDTDIGDQTSVDPGPLFACRGDLLVSFPQVAGQTTWKGLPWGALTVASDGNDCLAPEAPVADAGRSRPGSRQLVRADQLGHRHRRRHRVAPSPPPPDAAGPTGRAGGQAISELRSGR